MGTEDYRHIKNSKGEIKGSSSHELKGSNSTDKKYQISLKAADVAILHPSFLCPVLKKPDDPLHLIILADDLFHTTFTKSVENGDEKGPCVAGIVARYLKIDTWKTIDKSQHASKPLFDSLAKAKKNIKVHHLWDLSDLKKYKLTNKEGELFAQIHPKVKEMYSEKGLTHGYEIIIENLESPADSDGLYNLSWVDYQKPQSEDEEGLFFELQDTFLEEYNNQYRKEYFPLSCKVENNQAPEFHDCETEIISYHPVFIADKECLDIGHLSDVHVSSRQHLFTKSKARLIPSEPEPSLRSNEIGPMVNTSYQTLKNLMDQMGSKIDLLIFTGDLIDYNRNYNPHNSEKHADDLKNSKDIWEVLNLDYLKDKTVYPIGIDNLVMYELFRWYYKEHGKPIMLISGNHEAYTLPYGISPRVKLLRSTNSTYNFWGNVFSDLDVEDVIKKNIKQAAKDRKKDDKEDREINDKRANEGIPADHNLTISEAVLMYGPDYARIVMGASYNVGGEKNFNAKNMHWFYHIFTPLQSYITTFSEQCFISLGWGEGERFMGHLPLKQDSWSLGGYLPRSVDGVTNEQFELIKQGTKYKKTYKFLNSHFTYINYNIDYPLSEEGELNYNNTWRSYGKYDYGTFEKNRYEVYDKLVKHEIHYTLSGHSHRHGLYQIQSAKSSWNRENMIVKGLDVDSSDKYTPLNGKTRVLVAACGGPIAVKNTQNEFHHWGFDTPSGNYITFAGGIESEIGLIRPKDIKTAKPRLAVALDYADIFLREEKTNGVFSTFESKKDSAPLQIKFEEKCKLPDKELIKNISLIIFMKGEKGKQQEVITLVGSPEFNNSDKYDYLFKPDKKLFRNDLRKVSARKRMGFIKIELNNSNNKMLKNYQNNDNWSYPVSIYSRQKIALDALERTKQLMDSHEDADAFEAYYEESKIRIKKNIKGFIIMRHEKYGEIPYFNWYRDNIPNEYS